jgi:hypothetical protein
MIACKTHNVNGYKVTIVPAGVWAKLKRPATYSWSESATWTTSYILPYLSSMPIDFVLQAQDTSDKPVAMLDYKWQLFRESETKNIFKVAGDGILRGSFKEDRILKSDIRIPAEEVSTGGYILMVQFSYRKEIVINSLTMVKYDVINSGQTVANLILAGVALVGTIFGVLITLALELLLKIR